MFLKKKKTLQKRSEEDPLVFLVFFTLVRSLIEKANENQGKSHRSQWKKLKKQSLFFYEAAFLRLLGLYQNAIILHIPQLYSEYISGSRVKAFVQSVGSLIL